MERLYTLNPKALWSQFKKEHFAFWMVCLYLILQYFDPLRIYQTLSSLPLDKVAIGLAVLGLPLDPQRRWVRDSTNIWMTLFWLVTIVSSAFAIYPAISWSHWFDFFSWYVIYFLIINVVTSPARYFIFLTIFLLANFKLAFFGARTWISRGFGFVSWGIMGPPGFFWNSADLSGEMLMFAPIAFELALFVKPRVKRITHWFLMAGALAGAMTVLGASTRGSQVALGVQSVWVAIQRKLKLKIVLGIVLIAGLGWALMPAAEKARFTSAGTDDTSVQRLDYWRAGLKMIESHPVLGVGYFNFAPVYAVKEPNERWFGAQLPHNIFIQVGTDAGLTGLAIFLMLIYRNLKITRDIRRMCERTGSGPAFAPSVARGLALATWGFVIAGQFNTVAYYPFLWINLAFTVSLANIVRRAAENSPSVNLSQSRSPFESPVAPGESALGDLPLAQNSQ
jgi:putative inorganic carbon (hco3(-)) transporter